MKAIRSFIKSLVQRQTVLLIACAAAALTAAAQGTVQVQNGAAVKTTGGVSVVLEDMHLVNDGQLVQSPGDGTLQFSGGASVFFSGGGNTILDRLRLARLGGSRLTLQRNLTVWGEVRFLGGLLDLDQYVLDLGETGSLQEESENSRAFTIHMGYIETERNLVSPVGANPGNLGAVITSDAALGHTIVRRGHLPFTVSPNNQSVLRSFEIHPANNSTLKATLRFRYFASETAGTNESNLSLWRADASGIWTPAGADNRSTSEHWVERSSISQFSTWTLAENKQPLLVNCPPTILQSADAGSCSAVVALTATATGNPAPVIVYKTGNTVIPSSHSFPVGTTSVTVTASNGVQPDVSCSFVVEVKDEEKPVVQCTPAVTVCTSGGVIAIPPVTTTDNCGVESIRYAVTGVTTRSGEGPNASGLFNNGISTILWTVKDIHGNMTTCTTRVETGQGIHVTIPTAVVLSSGIKPNTVYIGYQPASFATLYAQPSGGTGPYTYRWSTGATTSFIIVSPQVATTYTVTVTDATGCSGTSTRDIYVDDIRCGNKLEKVMVCKPRPNAPPLELCIASSAVADHLKQGAFLGACGLAVTAEETGAEVKMEMKGELSVKVSPNPSTQDFLLRFESSGEESMELRVVDVFGRILSSRDGIQRGSSLRMGGSWHPGVYFVEVRQGKERVTLKLVRM